MKAQPLQVIGRAEFKSNGSVLYRVRGSRGAIYETTFFGGKPSGCTCPSWTRPCKHMTWLQARENERRIDADLEAHVEDELRCEQRTPESFTDAERTAFNSYELSIGA